MIDDHMLATIRVEAANWCLDGRTRGTKRTHAVACHWGHDDSTRLDGVLVVLEERRGDSTRTLSTLFRADDPMPIVPRTIRDRFSGPFSEAKR